MKILIVGSTGVLGKNVIPRLLERGHHVIAVARRKEQVDRLRMLGVDSHVGDILDPNSLRRAIDGCDAALHLATAIPRTQRPEDWERNDQIRREGTRNLLDVCLSAGVRRYVQQSITFFYGDQGRTVVDESTPLRAEGRIQSAADMEAMVTESTLDWCILRGGAFYGPASTAEQRWREAIVAGELKLPGNGHALVSLIHEVDYARAVVLAVEAAPARSIYNVVDDHPVTYRDLYAHVAALAGVDPPLAGGAEMRSLAVSNALIKDDLGWTPAYPSYRSGIIA